MYTPGPDQGGEIQKDHGRVADALAEMVRDYKYSEIVALLEKGKSYE